MKVLKKYGYEKNTDKIFIQSFHPATLKSLKTNISLVQLIGENSWGDSSVDFEKLKTNKGLREIKSYATGIGIWINHMKKDPTLIPRAKKIGLLVHAYTHRPEKTSHSASYYFNKLKLDGVFTDSPKLRPFFQ